MDTVYKSVEESLLYNGYQASPIWKTAENYGTYYNYSIDKQCRIPGRSLEEIQAEVDALDNSNVEGNEI